MTSKDILYSNGRNDECFTPEYGVLPILKYISEYKQKVGRSIIVWCPFDTEDSNFVKMIKSMNDSGIDVVHSHINEGKDFFAYEPENWDIIISNPPFTKKRKFFERALDLGKPFALLMTLTIFNDKYPAFSFYEKDMTMQLLKFDKRIKFEMQNDQDNNKITFSSGYICYNFLPKDLILENISCKDR